MQKEIHFTYRNGDVPRRIKITAPAQHLVIELLEDEHVVATTDLTPEDLWEMVVSDTESEGPESDAAEPEVTTETDDDGPETSLR